MLQETKQVYYIKTPQLSKKRYRVDEILSVGSDASCDVRVINLQVSPLHGRFRVQNDILTFTNLSTDSKSQLNQSPLGHGRSYILEKGDTLNLSELQITIDVIEEHFQEDLDESDKTEQYHVQDSKHQEDQEDYSNEATHTIKSKTQVIKDLLSKIRKEKKPELEKKIKKEKTQKLAGFLMRFWAFILDIILLIVAYSHFSDKLPISKIKDISDSLVPMIIPYVMKGYPIQKETLSLVLFFIFLYLLWNLAFQVILSNSITLFLMGATNSTSLIKSKLLVPMRSIIGYITLPFLILDLPIIIGKRTFKEFVTKSSILKRSSVVAFFSGTLVLPALIFTGLSLPFILEFDHFINPTYIEKFPFKSQNNKDSVQFSSSALSLEGQIQNIKEYQLIPSVRGDQVSLNIIDVEKKQQFSLQSVEKEGLRKVLTGLSKKDIFFHLHSPFTNEMSSPNKESSKISQEISSLVEHSLYFSFPGLSSFILNHGPILYPYYDLRKKIFELLEIAQLNQVEQVQLGSETYYVTYPNSKRILIIKPDLEKTYGWSLVSYSGNKALSMKVIKNFFSFSQRTLKQSFIQNELESFKVLNTIEHIKSRENLTTEEQKLVVDYYTKEAYSLIQKQDEYTLDLFKRNLIQLDRFLLRKSEETQFPEYSNLRLALNTLQKAILDLNLDFFKLNLQPVPNGFEEIMDVQK